VRKLRTLDASSWSPSAESGRSQRVHPHARDYLLCNPGGGAEYSFGRFGFRVDAGDFIYWNAGVHNNLVVKFGPQIKF
jgi:hypothetical protein